MQPKARAASFAASASVLSGKHVGMVSFSPYPVDPRPRRMAGALMKEGMTVDLICLEEDKEPRREKIGSLDVWRLPITHRRGGKFLYAFNYSSFIFLSALIFAFRSIWRRYDVIYVNNMPDVLVVSALFPKLLGAKVILDLHDPMPELMTTIFNLDKESGSVRLIRWLEKWSMARAHAVLTVNAACKKIFSGRSCKAEKIRVVMNVPDESIFAFQPVRPAKAGKRFVMMYHGSLVERNGLDLAVAALGKMKKNAPGAELQVFGRRTPFLDQVMKTVAEQGLQDCVHYHGAKTLEELVVEIGKCDVGVIPNQRNAFTDINTPTRIFEYLALGKPVIAPRTPGIQDYFTPDSLLFFESGNADELAAQLEYAVHHPRELTEVARRGQQVYAAHAWSEEKRTLIGLVADLLKDGES